MTKTTHDWDFDRISEAVSLPPEAGRAPGTRLGRYRIVREIAHGAMGVVYEAEDEELNRLVAVKILRDLPGASPVIRQRFEREAQSAAKLSHPNVVRLYDAGEDGGRMYLVMELIDGTSLRDVLSGRRYDLRPMLELLEKVARGVAAAHEAGIVHRDLKPANVLVNARGEPKIGDFGLAHWLDSEAGLTRSGSPMGTPMYMSPEQVRGGGGGISPATDVFALGAILYEILTGRPPHTGDSTMEIYSKVVSEEPVLPRRINARIHRELETIAMKALEKDPARRYAGAGAFADDLRRHLNGESILARPPGAAARTVKWAKRHRVTTTLLLASAAAVAVLLAGLAAASARETERRRAEVARFMEDGGRALREREALEAGIEPLRETERSMSARLELETDGDLKKPLWELRRRIAENEDQASARGIDAVAAYLSALGVEPGHAGARAALARYHVREYERAERDGDRRAMDASARMVGIYDDGSLAPSLAQAGSFSIDSVPSGASIDLFVYREGEDRRLVAEPFRRLGPGPAAPGPLPSGSYLAVLAKPGFRDVRYPFRIERGSRHAARVVLHTDEAIGAAFVYVPAGPFIAGGDPRAAGSWRLQVAETPGFFIARHEVTCGEYLEFLGGVIASEGVRSAQRRAPREAAETRYLWAIPEDPARLALPDGWDPRWQVFGVSREDAEAFARWKTGRGRSGRYRLPTEMEWEKAARGADGRCFPWGDDFDASFLVSRGGGPGEIQMLPVGSAPKDESPCGVRDMAGSAMEHVDGQLDGWPDAAIIRGGASNVGVPDYSRCASRFSTLRGEARPAYGFRLVREPERDP